MLSNAANRLLVCFVGTDVWTFADLCKQAGYSTDLGGYYVRQLVRMGYLSNTSRGRYAITPKGRIQITVAEENQLFVARPRLIVLILAKQGSNYVILRRTVQPFIGVAEWAAGAVRLGESISAAARRVASSRLGKSYEPVFSGFFRQIEHYQGQIFDDKLFAVHSLTIPVTDNLKSHSDTGEVELQATTGLRAVSRPVCNLIDVCNYTQRATSSPYEEHKYELSPSDFGLDPVE